MGAGCAGDMAVIAAPERSAMLPARPRASAAIGGSVSTTDVPRPGAGHHVEAGADALRPLGHDAQSHMRLVGRPVAGGKALAVVAHLEPPLRLLLHVQPHLRRPRMLAHVGQRLLHDVQHLHLQDRRQRHALALHPHARS